VISPWSVGGYVNSDVLDHTSGLKFVAQRFGVPLDGIVSQWRLATVGDMTTTMDFTTPVTSTAALAPYLQSLSTAYATSQTMLVSTGTETVPSPGEMPTQEPGTRPRRDSSTMVSTALPEASRPVLLLGAGAVAAAAAATVVAKRRSSEGDAAGAPVDGARVGEMAGQMVGEVDGGGPQASGT
jgi:phospholipase C